MSPCPEGDHLGVQACVQVHPANQADGWRVSSIHSKFNLKRRIGVAKEFRETNVYLESAACRAISRPLRHFSTQIFRRKERFAGKQFYVSANFTHFISL